MKTIKIFLEGERGSGRTTVLAMITSFLERWGFEVEWHDEEGHYLNRTIIAESIKDMKVNNKMIASHLHERRRVVIQVLQNKKDIESS